MNADNLLQRDTVSIKLQMNYGGCATTP